MIPLVQDFLTTVPGLEALFTGTFHNDIVWDTASAFSRKIGLLIAPLSTETDEFLQENWSEDTGTPPSHMNGIVMEELLLSAGNQNGTPSH